MPKWAKDISCNLGSLNIAKRWTRRDFAQSIEVAIRALTAVSVSDATSWSVRPDRAGNNDSHAIGWADELHGYLGARADLYGSEEGIDFTNIYFYTRAVFTPCGVDRMRSSVARTSRVSRSRSMRRGSSSTATTEQVWEPKTDRVKQLFADAGIHIPTQRIGAG